MTTDIKDLTNRLENTRVEDGDTLSFEGRGLKLDTEESAEEIVEAIRNFSKLTSFRMEGNTIGVQAAKAIGKALESKPELKNALWRDMFTGRLKTEIPEALRFLSGGLILAGAHLVQLDLSDNAFGPVGVEGIVELLKSETCYSLLELRLNNNGLGIQGGKLLAQSLLECHKNSTDKGQPLKLKVFVCGRNRLENEGATAIAGVFKTLGTLEEVQMPQNGIFFPGIQALARALRLNTGLKHLNLNDNIFTEEGAKAMAEALPSLQNLEVVNFGDCLIKSIGALSLADALESGHEKLMEVHLSYNEIDRDASIRIVESLDRKLNLKLLDLNGNKIGEEGRDKIKALLEKSNKIDVLGSLSDDAEDDDDDDDYDDEDDDGEGFEDYDDDVNEEDDDENDDEPKDDIEKVTATNNGPKTKLTEEVTPVKSTAAEFLQEPTSERLLGLGNNRVSLLMDALIQNSGETDKYVNAWMKIAASFKNDPDVRDVAYDCVDAVLSKGFKEAEDNDTSSNFTNTLLVHLGLIKSEDKKVKPPADLMGALTLLEHAVKQKYFPKATKEIFQFFFSKYRPTDEKVCQISHRLMQALYQ